MRLTSSRAKLTPPPNPQAGRIFATSTRTNYLADSPPARASLNSWAWALHCSFQSLLCFWREEDCSNLREFQLSRDSSLFLKERNRNAYNLLRVLIDPQDPAFDLDVFRAVLGCRKCDVEDIGHLIVRDLHVRYFPFNILDVFL